MSKLVNSFNFSNIDEGKELRRFLSIYADSVSQAVNGNLEFDINLRTKTVTVNFTTANTQKEISHDLGRTPIGYILVQSNASTTLYDGGTTNTDSKIYLKSSSVANTTILVF